MKETKVIGKIYHTNLYITSYNTNIFYINIPIKINESSRYYGDFETRKYLPVYCLRVFLRILWIMSIYSSKQIKNHEIRINRLFRLITFDMWIWIIDLCIFQEWEIANIMIKSSVKIPRIGDISAWIKILI